MIEETLPETASLFEAVGAIEASRRRIAVVVAQDRRLLGTLTDGDVRRCLLKGGSLDTPVAEAMNRKPVQAREGTSGEQLVRLMRQHKILAVPLVDFDDRLLRLVHLSDIAPAEPVPSRPNFACAVIMAGGEGMRLRPMTEHLPKPMIDIGGVPLLEQQVRRLVEAGIQRIYLAVNYLSKVIEDHFTDGSLFDADIRYIHEREKLGTGGALSLLPEKPQSPVLVMNGDILTTSDFLGLSAFHHSHKADITVAAINYSVHIPFGVLQNKGSQVVGLIEKPSQRFLCNAGIYVLSPHVLDTLPGSGAFNMPDVITKALIDGRQVSVFPVHEYWSDIGTPADLDKARVYFGEKDA